MQKIKSLSNSDKNLIGYLAYCPGCKFSHAIFTEDVAKPRPLWLFNGDMEKPTFKPSLLVTYGRRGEEGLAICHSFIRDGQWQYLNDCTHSLAGTVVDMVDVKDAA